MPLATADPNLHDVSGDLGVVAVDGSVLCVGATENPATYFDNGYGLIPREIASKEGSP